MVWIAACLPETATLNTLQAGVRDDRKRFVIPALCPSEAFSEGGKKGIQKLFV